MGDKEKVSYMIVVFARFQCWLLYFGLNDG